MRLQMLGLPYQIVFSFLIGMMGASMASFMTCMGSRMAAGKDWVHGHSECDSCGAQLDWKDLIPIFSYLSSGGKCRHCGAKIPVSCIIGEVLMAVYFVLSVWIYGFSGEALRCMGLACILLGLSVVDLAIYEIPDEFIIAGIVLWLITIPICQRPWLEELKFGLLGGFGIGGGMLLLSLIFDRIIKRDSLGGGDIKLFFMTGLYLGIGAGFFSLILSCIVGLGFVVLLKKEKIPFGPAISIATAVSMLCGNAVVGWYLGLFL